MRPGQVFTHFVAASDDEAEWHDVARYHTQDDDDDDDDKIKKGLVDTEAPFPHFQRNPKQHNTSQPVN